MTDTLAHDEQLFEAHQGQHQDCPPCFAIKLQSLSFQGPGAGERRQSEASRSRDMDDYQSLRRQGYQPAHVFGTHEVMMQAGSQFEVEHNMVMAPAIRKEMEARMADMPPAPSTKIPKGAA